MNLFRQVQRALVPLACAVAVIPAMAADVTVSNATSEAEASSTTFQATAKVKAMSESEASTKAPASPSESESLLSGVSAVPEPETAFLWLGGLAGLVALRRRQRRA